MQNNVGFTFKGCGEAPCVITQIKHSLRHVCVQPCLCYTKLNFEYLGIAGLLETMNALRKEKHNIKLEAAS